MIIYLDFDGTVVEHQYPGIGRCNFGCIEVLHKLKQAGHQIVLNTMRCEFSDNSLIEASKWFDNAWMLLKDKELVDVVDFSDISTTQQKRHPQPFNMVEFKKQGYIMIDDNSYGVPLIDAVMTNGKMVDWQTLDIIFEKEGIYTKN